MRSKSFFFVHHREQRFQKQNVARLILISAFSHDVTAQRGDDASLKACAHGEKRFPNAATAATAAAAAAVAFARCDGTRRIFGGNRAEHLICDRYFEQEQVDAEKRRSVLSRRKLNRYVRHRLSSLVRIDGLVFVAATHLRRKSAQLQRILHAIAQSTAIVVTRVVRKQIVVGKALKDAFFCVWHARARNIADKSLEFGVVVKFARKERWTWHIYVSFFYSRHFIPEQFGAI